MTKATTTAPAGGPAVAAPARPSYRDLNPLEEGGRIARVGVDYQDHVAASKCLDMFLPNGPAEVWCETEDDIVSVWRIGGTEHFEFTQVKGDDIKKAWSVATLCHRESGAGKKLKSSILEKSLNHDRGSEPCRFRIVTRWDPDKVLDVLKLELDDRGDPTTAARLAQAALKVDSALPAISSPNGNSVQFWVENTVWEHRAQAKDIENENLLKLARILAAEGDSLSPDQLEELYSAVIAKVQKAALPSAVTHKADKRLVCDELRTWLKERVRSIHHPQAAAGVTPLVRKLNEAGVDDTTIESAQSLRRAYLSEVRTAKYLTTDDREAAEDSVIATLHSLKLQLDAGELPDDGRAFHRLCDTEVRKIGLTSPKHTDALLLGCMYDVMNRCLHRLRRVNP